jgi:Dyp-type peroxidase family
MGRDLQAEPLLATDAIQGDILPGLAKRTERLLFFEIVDVARFRTLLADLAVTSMQECLDQRATIAAAREECCGTVVATPGLNVAFTFSGLDELAPAGLHDSGPAADASFAAFTAGMAASASTLDDPAPTTWKILKPQLDVHGVFIVTGATPAEVSDVIALRLTPQAANGWNLLHEEIGTVRPEPVRGHEHFGYADGVSQPGVRGRICAGEPLMPCTSEDPDQAGAGEDLLWPGLFLFGHPAQDPSAKRLTVKGPVRTPPLPFMADGAYLVFRRLKQLVPEFDQSVKAAARTTAANASVDAVSAEQLGAQLVGRWKSGAPVILAPSADDPSLADGTPRVNDFEFGDDREGVVCPWAAHVRKAYPRDDVPGSTSPGGEQVDAAEAFTQTHRMMRRGIAFGPELSDGEALKGKTAQDRGLLFKCYVTSLVDQFEFVQQTWIDNPGFVQPNAGVDAVMGQPDNAPTPFLGAAAASLDPARKPQLTLAHFVHMQGGQYFFAPSIPALRAL